jgi:hypothetical protein
MNVCFKNTSVHWASIHIQAHITHQVPKSRFSRVRRVSRFSRVSRASRASRVGRVSRVRGLWAQEG